MPREPIRFRCYKCGKLLGISQHKAGQTTTCPKCQADLIVPVPEAASDSVVALAIDVETEGPPSTPRTAPGKAEPRAGSSGGPGSFSWEEVDTSLFEVVKSQPIDLPIRFGPPSDPPRAVPLPPAPVSVAPAPPVATARVDEIPPTVATPVVPDPPREEVGVGVGVGDETVETESEPRGVAPGPVGVEAIEVPVEAIRTNRRSARKARAGDVVLSQGVVTSWLVFVAIALGVAFLAGLFAGHYLWKPR